MFSKSTLAVLAGASLATAAINPLTVTSLSPSQVRDLQSKGKYCIWLTRSPSPLPSSPPSSHSRLLLPTTQT